jgi:hypothetical protein
MVKKKLPAFLFQCIVILFSCKGNNNTRIIPVPPKEYFIQEKKIIDIDIDNITETKDGSSAEYLPVWLKAYINGGAGEVEKIDAYRNKYAFIGTNEGINFAALNIWAENFSTVQNFTMLSAQRIQRRIISAALHYPDDEYGIFFEKMIKSAYSAVYRDVSKEDIYWVKLEVNNKPNNEEIFPESESVNGSSEIYIFFILLIIDKTVMQSEIHNMLEEAYLSSAPVGSHNNAIKRLRLKFFEGF